MSKQINHPKKNPERFIGQIFIGTFAVSTMQAFVNRLFLPRPLYFHPGYIGAPILLSRFKTTYCQVWDGANIGIVYTNHNQIWPEIPVEFVQNENNKVFWSPLANISAEYDFDCVEISSRNMFEFLDSELSICQGVFSQNTSRTVIDCLRRHLEFSPQSGKFRCLFLNENLFIGFAVEYSQNVTWKLKLKKKAKIYCVRQYIQN